MANDWLYAVEVYDDNQTLLTVENIEQRLRSIVRDVMRRAEAHEAPVPVGILSADHRDRWTEVRGFMHPSLPINSPRLELSIPSLPLCH
jgi:hypothetical protein